MNSTEERLRDALHGAARTVGSAPEFTAPSRRSPFGRPFAASIAVAASIAGAAFVTGGLPLPSTVLHVLAPPPKPHQVAVFLCIRVSSNEACRHRDSTEGERQAILDRLTSLPEVREVSYESRAQAYARFQSLFENTPSFLTATKVDDVPDSFRFEVEPGSTAKVEDALHGLSGIDAVVDQTEEQDASRTERRYVPQPP